MSAALHVDRRRAMPSGAGAPAATLPLVMVHGWGMNLRVFDLLRAEVPGHETWAVDLPGHGRSAWRSDAAHFEVQQQMLLDVLPERCVLLGWSLGAKLALSIAARHPGRVAALVLVSPTPRFAQDADWPHGMDARAMTAFRTVLEQDWRQTLSDFVWLQLRGSRNAELAQRSIEAALNEQGAPDPRALGSGMALLGSIDLRTDAGRIHQPALIIAGQNDRVTPAGAARWLAATLPRSELVEVARAGHAPHVSHSDEVGAALRGYLHGIAGEIAA